MKIKTYKIITSLALIVSCGAFFLLNYVTGNISYIFALNILILIIICRLSGFSIFTLQSITINYIQLPIVYQKSIGSSYGLLELSASSLEYEKIFLGIFLYNITIVLLLLFTNCLSKENKKQKFNIKIKGRAVSILSILSIVFAIIAFPKMPLFYSGINRFDSLLPGKAWNHLSIVCLLFLYNNYKTSKIVRFAYFFCITWFLLHFERVDIIGLISFIIIMKNKYKNISKTIKVSNIIRTGLLVLVTFSIFTAIGNLRSGSEASDLNKPFKGIFVQKTASDIAYIYNISIVYSRYRSLNGATYIQYLYETVPTLSPPITTVNELSSNFMYPGGQFILSEPIINFGIFFIPVATIILFFIVYRILSIKNVISVYWYYILLAATFRINWYGIQYVETAIIWIIPIIYFLLQKTQSFDSLDWSIKGH